MGPCREARAGSLLCPFPPQIFQSLTLAAAKLRLEGTRALSLLPDREWPLTAPTTFRSIAIFQNSRVGGGGGGEELGSFHHLP